MKLSIAPAHRILILSWVLVLIVLSLILRSCLYSDDIQDFQLVRSLGPMSASQVTHYIYGFIVSYFQSGRFTPVAHFFHSLIYCVSSTVLIYKIILFVLNIGAVFSFTVLLRSLGLKEWIPLALLVFCATAQFYINYHDAFTSLHGMYPILAIFLFTTMSLFIAYLRNGRVFLLTLTLLMTLLTVLNCEIGFVVYPLLILLLMADHRSFFRKVVLFVPFFLLLVAYIYVFIYIRKHAEHLYSGVETSFSVAKMANVFLVQLLATLPLTSFIGMPSIPNTIRHELVSNCIYIFIMIVAFIPLLYYVRKHPFNEILTRKKALLLLMALVLMLLPPMLLMISSKYQQEMHFGMGYLPVYIQNFGFVLLILLLFDFLFARFSNSSGLVINVSFTLLLVLSLFTFMRNAWLVEITNYKRGIPSCFYYKSLKNGILKDCENGSLIVLRTDYIYHGEYMYGQMINNFYSTGLNVIGERDFHEDTYSNSKPIYLLEHDADQQTTSLYRLQSYTAKTLVKRIKYPSGDDFSYFALISKPL